LPLLHALPLGQSFKSTPAWYPKVKTSAPSMAGLSLLKPMPHHAVSGQSAVTWSLSPTNSMVHVESACMKVKGSAKVMASKDASDISIRLGIM